MIRQREAEEVRRQAKAFAVRCLREAAARESIVFPYWIGLLNHPEQATAEAVARQELCRIARLIEREGRKTKGGGA